MIQDIKEEIQKFGVATNSKRDLKDPKSEISRLMKQKPITLENINDIEKKLGDLAKDGAFLSAEYFIGKLEEIKVLTDKPEI